MAKDGLDRSGPREDNTLNDARIVGQLWFRGQRNSKLGLTPGLYRERTWEKLRRHGSKGDEEELFDELFDLEHEIRIDFTSYGHLLNESNQAKAPIDWYFLMQHHGVPTRLLDWPTNALAGLFFAIAEYDREQARPSASSASTVDEDQDCVAVWMVDAYWLAGRLSDEWSGPLLPYSEDASTYVPPLERLIERMKDARALVPKHAMPIEPRLQCIRALQRKKAASSSLAENAICWTRRLALNETMIARRRNCA